MALTGSDDGYGLVTVTGFRGSDTETRPAKPWRISCSTWHGEGLRGAIRNWVLGPTLLAHPALRVTERATHTLGRYITPEESCATFRAQGMGCDPISGKLWVPRIELPPTQGDHALTIDDTREQVRVMPLVHLGCDGALRFVVRFNLATADRIDHRPNGKETELIVRHLEMEPIMLDMLTGERLPADLSSAMVWEVETGTIMNAPIGMLICARP